LHSDSVRTARWKDLDAVHVWHPFTPMTEHARERPPVIVSAEGFWLIDSEGQRYLDGVSSLWCNVHGHRVPELDAAIRDQLDRVAHTTLLGLSNEPSIELARELVEVAPSGLDHVFFSDDGSTAVEAALKIVYQHHRQKLNPQARHLFARLTSAYHGDTVGAVSIGGIDLFHGAYGGLLFRTLAIPAPVTCDLAAGQAPTAHLEWCFTELERLLREHAADIAGFVIEPLVQMAGGVLVHPPGYLRRVRELTRALDIPLIVDEVATGFGRTGTLFACEREGVSPDVMCLSKGLTGGYLPLGATLVTTPIYESFLGERRERRTFYHGHTFSGNPLGCAVARASLARFASHRVLDNVARTSNRLDDRLSVWRGHPHVLEVRVCGLLAGVDLARDPARRERFPSELAVGHRVVLAARKRGVFLRPLGDVIEIVPAPAMPVELLDHLCDVVEESIGEVLGEVVR
jgi:adenosylmethionine---8-amino-7-oxononanoate aminotransferase